MAVRTLLFARSAGDNVFVNQAIEAALLDRVRDGEAALYLWRNADAVVLGRNQDAFAECRVDALEAAGGALARRLSGGGAVFHDGGNLNFTFIGREGEFEKDANFRTVLAALSALGVKAELSGRNDLIAAGAKFGGNAYLRRGGTMLHHGTLLITTDPARVERFLTPPEEKLSVNGVRSVSSRVAPLCDIADGVTVERAEKALFDAWRQSAPEAALQEVQPVSLGAASVMKWTGFFSADEWRYGKKARYTTRFETTLFGRRAVVRTGEGGEVALFSDGMDADAVEAVRVLLEGGGPSLSEFDKDTQNAIRTETERLRALITEDGDV